MLKNTRKGFTLVELIVVIVILATLATVAFITLQDYPIQARDSKRTQDISSISQKMSAEYTKGTVKLSDFINGAGTGIIVNVWSTNYEWAYWPVNYETIKESKESFSDPNSGKAYYALYLEGGTGTGKVRCFEIATIKEIDDTVAVKWNCNTFPVLSTADQTKLFSRIMTGSTVQTSDLYTALKDNLTK